MLNLRTSITLGLKFTWLDSYRVISLYLLVVNWSGWLASAMIRVVNRLTKKRRFKHLCFF